MASCFDNIVDYIYYKGLDRPICRGYRKQNKTKQSQSQKIQIKPKPKQNQNKTKKKKTRVIYKSGNEYPFVAHAIHEYRTDIVIQVGNLCVELLSSLFPWEDFSWTTEWFLDITNITE